MKSTITALARYLAWTLPFATFILAYCAVALLTQGHQSETPALVGNSIEKALTTLSEQSLNMRIVAHHEVAHLPSGTILSQIPHPSTPIKRHQTVCCVVSQAPAATELPDLIGLRRPAVEHALKGLSYRIYDVASSAPAGTCCAHYPAAHTPLAAGQEALVYLSTQSHEPVAIPMLKERMVSDIQEPLRLAGIAFTIEHEHPVDRSHVCNTCKVVRQRPLAGTLILPTSGTTLTLQVSNS